MPKAWWYHMASQLFATEVGIPPETLLVTRISAYRFMVCPAGVIGSARVTSVVAPEAEVPFIGTR
jgi:hypothetical protein